MRYKDDNNEIMCDYGHRFITKNIKLVPFKNKPKVLLGKVIFVKNEDDEYYEGGAAESGYFLACPTCGIIQPGGFRKVKDKQLDVTETKEPDRNVTLHL